MRFALAFIFCVLSFSGLAESKSCFTIKTLSCGSCVNKAKSKLNGTDGVVSSEVTLESGYTEVVYKAGKTNADALLKVITEKAEFEAEKTACKNSKAG